MSSSRLFLQIRKLVPVMSDALAIVLIQAVNFLVPLAALPFVARALGIEQFGLYAALLNYTNCVVLLGDYSFNVNGPLRIQAARQGNAVVRLLLDSTLLKLGLLVPGIVLFLLAALFLAGVSIEVALVGALLPTLTTLTPRWAVYGTGRLYPFFFASVLVRGAWLALVIVFIQSRGDLFTLLLLTAAAQAFIAGACFWLLWPEKGDPWRPGWRGPAHILKEDAPLFASSGLAGGAKELGLLLLSALRPVADVSIYAVADRVRVVLLGLSAPLTQALFLSVVRSKGVEADREKLRAVAGTIVVLLVAAGSLLVFMLADWIVLVLAGPEFSSASDTLRILCLVPPLATLNSILGANTLLVEGHQSAYAWAQVAAALLFVPMAFALVGLLGISGAALAAVALELVTAGFYLHAILRLRLLRRPMP